MTQQTIIITLFDAVSITDESDAPNQVKATETGLQWFSPTETGKIPEEEYIHFEAVNSKGGTACFSGIINDAKTGLLIHIGIEDYQVIEIPLEKVERWRFL